MLGENPDAAQVALDLVEALTRAGLSVAIGGSLALAAWGQPRWTKDVDLNAFVEEAQHPRVLDVLVAAGCTPDAAGTPWTEADRERFLRSAREGEVAVSYLRGVRVDVFVPSIPFYEEAERTVSRLELPDRRSVPVLSAEALAVFKLLFFRDRDLVDLRRLVARQGGALDAAWVRAHVVGMVGEDDERAVAWDEIVREHGPAARDRGPGA